MSAAPTVKMTAEEFLGLPETMTPCELIEGEIVMSPAPEDVHQKAIGRTYRVLLPFVDGDDIRLAPTDLKLNDVNFVQPDLFWVSPDNSACVLVEGKYWRGAPDLVVEIVSPSSQRHDRVVKFGLYEKYGVREYWLVDTESARVEVWVRQGVVFARQGSYGAGKTFASLVLGGAAVAAGAIVGA